MMGSGTEMAWVIFGVTGTVLALAMLYVATKFPAKKGE